MQALACSLARSLVQFRSKCAKEEERDKIGRKREREKEYLEGVQTVIRKERSRQRTLIILGGSITVLWPIL